MSRILLSPAKYVQGKGELARLAQYVLTLGQKPFILISSSGQKRFGLSLIHILIYCFCVAFWP